MSRIPPAATVAIAIAIAALLLAACAGTGAPVRIARDPLPAPLALSCLTCHAGPDADRHAVDLSTRAPDAIANALREYRDGARAGTVMPRLARGLGEDDIERLAHAFAPPTRDGGHAE